MNRFFERNQADIVGVLSGFGGSLRSMDYLKGFDKFLGALGVLYKDFGKFAQAVSVGAWKLVAPRMRAISRRSAWRGDSSPTRTLTDPVSRRIVRDGRPYRALRPIDPEEARIFSLLLDGQFLIQGFRNRDLRERLIPRAAKTLEERRRVSARISRMLRLLRAHSVIRKVSTSSYYRVTSYGQQLMTAALRLRNLNVLALVA